MKPTPSKIIGLALFAFFASRILTGLLFTFLDEVNEVPLEDLGDRVNRYCYAWDSGWYGRIARSGYENPVFTVENGQSPLAFYPLYPLTIRAVSSISGLSIQHAAILNANVFHLIAMVLFGFYCKSRGGDWVVIRNATLLFAFCPQGHVFASAYTESLFVMLTLAALLSFESGRYYTSCLCSGALSAVRANGVFILIYYVFHIAEDAFALWKNRQPVWPYITRNSAKLLPIMFVPLGLFLFWWFSFNLTGDAFAQKSTASHGWHRSMLFPFAKIPQFLAYSPKTLFFAVSSLAMFGLSFLLLPTKLYKDFAYCLANFLLFFSASISDSLLRYAIALFPIYVGIALFTRNRPAVFAAALIAFIGFQLFTSYAWYERFHISL